MGEDEDLDDMFKEFDSDSMGMSDIGENGTSFCMIDYEDRGKQYDDLDEGYNRNVQAVREFQREDGQWGGEIREEEDSLHRSQGDSSVYVIDDASLMLEEDSSSDYQYSYRPSDYTVVNSRVSSYMPSFNPVKQTTQRRMIKCSKESMMIMQDLDSLAEGSDDHSQSSHHSTVILPSIRNRPSNLSLRSNDSTDSIPRQTISRLPPVNMNRLPPHLFQTTRK